MGGNRGLGGLFETHRYNRMTGGWELTPLSGALLYLVFGFVSLYVSDVVFVRYFSEPMLSQVQAVKAGVEVFLTGVLVFLLIRKSRARSSARTRPSNGDRRNCRFSTGC